MAEINKVLCCSSRSTEEQKSVSTDALQARPCAGSETLKAAGGCQCSQQCLCKSKLGACATSSSVQVNLCASTGGAVPPCTMPGNCQCCKGSVAKM